MGLSISVLRVTRRERIGGGSYHGYSAFRRALAERLGLGKLDDVYRGFGGEKPFPWFDQQAMPFGPQRCLMVLIDHSDCEGYVSAERLMGTDLEYREEVLALLEEFTKDPELEHWATRFLRAAKSMGQDDIIQYH